MRKEAGHIEPAYSVMSEQVGGDHYKKLAIQPIYFCHVNKLGPCESSAVRYLSRYKDKNGLQDLQKAIHFIQILMKLEYGIESSMAYEDGKGNTTS